MSRNQFKHSNSMKFPSIAAHLNFSAEENCLFIKKISLRNEEKESERLTNGNGLKLSDKSL